MIEVNNLTATPVNKESLKRITEKVLKGEKKANKTISIAFVGKIRIKELNRKYRKKDKATDVLSFDYGDSGEVVICPDLAENIAHSLIHGILHLSGYDHEKSKKEEKRMQDAQNHYLKTCQKLI